MNKFLDKMISDITVKVLNEETMTVDHCISDEKADRVGDVIFQAGIDTANFMLNPVVLDCHNYSAPPIGKCLKLYQENGQTRAVTQFAPTEKGKEYFGLVKDGFLNGWSVGIIPHEYNGNSTGGYDIKTCELLEYSLTPVPCNPRALKSFIEDKKEDKKIDKEQIEALVKEQMKPLEDKVKELETENETLKTEKAQLEEQINEKSGAKLSKVNMDTLSNVCHSFEIALEDLKNFIDTNTAEEGKGLEDDFTEDDLKEFIKSQLTSILKK